MIYEQNARKFSPSSTIVDDLFYQKVFIVNLSETPFSI